MSNSQNPRALTTATPELSVVRGPAPEPRPSARRRPPVRDVEELERAIGHAARHNVRTSEVIPLLRQLVRVTPGQSQVGARARVLLVQKLLSGDSGLPPVSAKVAWECARACHEAQSGPLSDAERARSYALLALAFCFLDCDRAACTALYRAVRHDPGDPVIAHNLGHLLDVRLGQPRAGLRWLRQAYRQLPDDPEIAASYAHALALVGPAETAIDVLSVALGCRAQARRRVAEWRSLAGEHHGQARPKR